MKGDNKMNREKFNRIFIISIKVLVILFFSLISIVAVYLKNDNDRLKSMINITTEDAVKEASKLTQSLASLTKEYESYKEKHGQGSINLEKKAIAAYIKTNYRRVPKELVESIAINVVNKSAKHNIPYELVVAIIEVESDFNPTAVSTKDARGLMQVTFNVWGTKLGITDRFILHEVDVGIDAGIVILKHYLDGHDGGKKGDLATALFLYVGKNKEYVSKVLTCMGNFVLFKSSI